MPQSLWISRPTAIFAGESVIFGKGLTWEESIPAQVGAMLGVPTANLAVDGYGTDQALLRLQAELPRFQPAHRRRDALHDVAVWQEPGSGSPPSAARSRLDAGSHARTSRPRAIRRAGPENVTVERGIAVTRDVLRATVDSRRRAARPR